MKGSQEGRGGRELLVLGRVGGKGVFGDLNSHGSGRNGERGREKGGRK